MLKNMIFSLIICVVVLTTGRMLLAQEAGGNTEADAALVNKRQEAGNKICPVSGEEINDEARAIYEYKGKIYNLCCAACIEEFKNNPDKYVQIVEAEKKNNK